MGKNHRHKKILKSEKAKTKLRVKSEKTKFLPKGLNVTKTDFKVKAIVLPEQLKSHSENEVLSQRKLNIKDILSRLKHHNDKVKFDCCEELKQLLSYHIEEIVEQNLSQILHGVSPLLLDREKKVRRNSIKILDIILDNAPLSKFAPFFPVLSSYLRCAMTNIDKAVQEDSLQFLDTLLRCCPSLVAQNRDKILPNLFALISKLRNDSRLGRTLTVNLGSSMTSVKWRIQVLSRLHRFLQAVDNQRNGVDEEVRSNCVVVKVSSDLWRVPVLRNPYKNNCLRLNLSEDKEQDEDEDIILKNMGTLMSLLFEIWLEVVPEKDYQHLETGNTILNSDTASVLTCILNIIHLQLDYSRRDDPSNFRRHFATNAWRNFLRSVLAQFPFAQHGSLRQESATILDTNNDPKCVRENLAICHLFSVMHKDLNRNFSSKDAKSVLNYINGCFMNRGYINEANLDRFVGVVRIILEENSLSWSDIVDIEGFLSGFLEFFETLGKKLKRRDLIFDVLCDISQIPHLCKLECYQRWLSVLPEVLCENEISSQMLDKILLIAKQDNKLFLNSFKDKLQRILGNYKSLKVLGEEDSKKNIIYMCYYIDQVNSDEFAILKNFAEKSQPICKKIVENILAKFEISQMFSTIERK